MTGELHFRILGPLEVLRDERPVELGGPKQRAVLAVLLLSRREVVSTDRLIDSLWGEHPPATASKTLQGYISHLRSAIGDDILVTRGRGYMLAAAPRQVDTERFEALVADARHALAGGDAAVGRELLGAALALWRGDALADLAYEPFAAREIARLQEARLTALEERIDADLTLGEHRELIGELESLVALHPHRERLLAQLMLALYRSGRQADALDTYQRGREALDDELGLEPGPQLRALEQQILTHDPALDPPTPAGRGDRITERARTARGRALIIAGGGLLLAAAIAAGVVELTGDTNTAPPAEPNSVAAIDTHTDRVVGQVAVGTRPGAIAFGSGSLWVANVDDQTVSRVDPKTLRTLRTLPVGDPPTGIAAAGGKVWVATSGAPATFVAVNRIDPQFDTIDRTARVGNVVPGAPAAIAARGAALWVAPFAGVMTRVDTRTGHVAGQVDPNAATTGIGVGADAAWVTDYQAGNVARADPSGLVTSIAVGHGPSGIAVADSGIWVADNGDDAVVQIDPSTKAVTTTIPVGRAPAGVSIGAGSVWVANSGDGTVTRIDPNTRRVITTIDVGGSPQAIAFSGGHAWVTIDAPIIPVARLAARGGTARADDPVDVDYVDPALAYGPDSWQLLYATCAKLVNYPDKGGQAGAQLVPEVAQALPQASADGKTYTFTIRAGFRFSSPSNEPVTAQTFKDTIERTLNPSMRSPVAAEFRDVVGARAYMNRKAAHIAGVVAQGSTLSIRLIAPAPDLLARLAQPFFCAVPSDTPIDPKGVRLIPSAGPYRIASYTPGQGLVLTPNPNYRGNRPHHLARIELAVGIPGHRAIAQVEAGTADYTIDGEVGRTEADTLAARYGPRSPAAKRGRQQYFVHPQPTLDFLALNTHRGPFTDVRLRRAVNYAIDRAALARVGQELSRLPEQPIDHYLPPGIPGYREVHIYPARPDLAKARQLAKGYNGASAILYTCDVAGCDEQAQVIKTNLAAIGIRVQVKSFSGSILYAKLAKPGEPFDIGYVGWLADYLDPDAFLNLLVESGSIIPALDDPGYRARLAAAARLTGAQRYLTYARLDADLARNAAPFVAWGHGSSHELFSARMGCQVYGPYGIDLAALCIRKPSG